MTDMASKNSKLDSFVTVAQNSGSITLEETSRIMLLDQRFSLLIFSSCLGSPWLFIIPGWTHHQHCMQWQLSLGTTPATAYHWSIILWPKVSLAANNYCKSSVSRKNDQNVSKLHKSRNGLAWTVCCTPRSSDVHHEAVNSSWVACLTTSTLQDCKAST